MSGITQMSRGSATAVVSPWHKVELVVVAMVVVVVMVVALPEGSTLDIMGGDEAQISK